MSKSSFVLWFLAVVILVGWFGVAQKTFASEYYITPSIVSPDVGEVFTVRVVLRSLSTKTNAFEGTVVFPPEMLEVVSIATGGSIILSWAEEPGYSNSAGTITFAGGIPQIGFQGAPGLLFQISFRAKKSGTATLAFKNGMALTADGKADNTLTAMQGATIIIRENAPSRSSGANTPEPSPPAPIISSLPISHFSDWALVSFGSAFFLLMLVLIGRELGWHHRIKAALKETEDIRAVLENSCLQLRAEIENRLSELEHTRGPRLTQAERRLRDELKRDLDIVERFLKKEIDDVEIELWGKYPEWLYTNRRVQVHEES